MKIRIIILIGILIIGSFSSISLSEIEITENETINNIYKYTDKDKKIEENEIISNDFLFDKIIKQIMKIACWPSLSICFINNDQMIWSKGYGFYDLENQKPATDKTIYNIASITKSITGTALMQLWEQGYFDLDEDVNNYLPFSLRNPNFPDVPITFRMLLSHSSSLRPEVADYEGITYYYWFNFSADPPFSFYPNQWLKDHLIPGGKWYFDKRWSTEYEPGEYAMYANANFDIVAYLVELISGEPFIDYCNEYIFSPLRMHNTSFNLSRLDINNVAIPYHYHNGEYLFMNELSYLLGPYTLPDKYWRMRMYPVGGLYTTISDLSHFFIAHMNNGVYDEIRILEEATVKEMHNVQPPGNIYGNAYFGLGWITTENPFVKGTFSGNGGGLIGVNTDMYYRVSDKVGFIAFTNGDGYYEDHQILRGMMGLIAFVVIMHKASGINS